MFFKKSVSAIPILIFVFLLLCPACSEKDDTLTADEVNTIFSREIEKVNQCNSDDDCIAFAADCPLACWYYINKENQVEIRVIHDELIDRYEDSNGSCTSSCGQSLQPVCVNLICTGQ